MKKISKNNYNHSTIELKWQSKWQKDEIYHPSLDTAKDPFYALMMFPYPSAEGLHVGNMYAFTGADIYARFMRMKGHDVFEPIGLDGFGIHSENYALKIGKHPMTQSEVNENRFYAQLSSIGNSFDWDRAVETYKPEYYKWTQWIFLKMYENDLAYKDKAKVNWCPSCKTVLADEQVIDEKCERCSSVVEKRELEQWFFRITNYADRLLNNLEGLNWTEKVKLAQKNWIGRSEGAQIEFKVQSSKFKVEVYTVYPETIYGVTYMVLAPEHELVEKITTEEKRSEVLSYIKNSSKKTEQARLAENKAKTGVFTGSYCINPVTKKKIPVWIADYVLAGYGTGAVMGVPGSDHRDYEFASKYNLPIVRVIANTKDDLGEIKSEKDVLEEGILVNSGEFSGLKTPSIARDKVKDYLIEKGFGERRSQYHLRDWLISRQRYWGPPIPIIYCDKCGTVPVPEKDLPVKLPYVEDFQPKGTGVSPLASVESFYKVKCPTCGGDAKREADVSDTFLDSAWYFFRYISTEFDDKPFDDDRVKKWLPVHMYIGGAEHSVLHLLYSRFITMFLKDMGLIQFDEPFARFYAHGLIIKDGAKMSKSKGNIINPDQYIKKFGADTLRCYLHFLGPFDQTGDFRDSGVEGMNRFLKRIWTLFSQVQSSKFKVQSSNEALKMMHQTIKGVTEDMDNLRYNTAIAKLMEYYNFLIKQERIAKEEAEVFLKLLAPFAPHIAEELFQQLSGNSKFNSIHVSSWPEFDEKYLASDTVKIAVQVNGKLRGVIEVLSKEVDEKEKIEKEAIENDKVSKFLDGKTVKKIIYVPSKVVNIVID